MIDDRRPVLIGVGVASQRCDDPTEAVEAVELMRRAFDASILDCGAPSIADRVDEIIVPEGIWRYGDPGRLVLDGRSPDARTVVADIGVVQQSVFSRAASAIAAGELDVVAVVTGEAKYRSLRARILGVAAPETSMTVEPDVRLRPALDVIPDLEIHRALPAPTHQYAVMESAIRAASGRTPTEHARHVAELVARFSRVAESNPAAWTRTPMTADAVLAAPMVAEPYTKPCCSQWNVDQASALLLCSVATARALGISADRWVFPLAGAESNLMVPLSERGELHRSPAVAAVGAALTDAAGIAPGDAALREIYSCFPAAVQIQCAELGIDVDGDLTVTGGMHFAGGPLNSFSLQALAALVPTLRERHDEVALVTSVSGMMTKFGAGLWSASPNDAFRSIDVTESARAATATRVVDGEAAGTAVVVGSTVGYVHGDATEAVVIADVPSGTRAVAVSRDAEVIAAFRGEEWVGRSVMVDGPVLRLG